MMQKIVQSTLSVGRILFVLLLVIGAFVFAMFQGGTVSWTIFYALVPFGVYSLCLFLYPLTSFSAERHVQLSHYQVGDTLKVEVRLTRKIPFPLLYTVVRDEWSGENNVNKKQRKEKLFLLGWKRKFSWVYETEQLARGELIASEIEIEVTDFFGWIRKIKHLPVETTILVYPKVKEIQFIPLEAQQVNGLAASPFKLLKDVNITTGVRDYEEGDRLSWIHWKSFARTETLMTKEFDDSGSQDLHLVFDNRQSPTFEKGVTFIASLLQKIEREGISISFLPIHQTNAWPQVKSAEQFQIIHTYLAKIHPVMTNEILPSTSFIKAMEADGEIVLVTGQLDDQIQIIMEKYRVRRRSISCFVIVEDMQSESEEFEQNINRAKEKGMRVRLIESRQFKEVVSR